MRCLAVGLFWREATCQTRKNLLMGIVPFDVELRVTDSR